MHINTCFLCSTCWYLEGHEHTIGVGGWEEWVREEVATRHEAALAHAWEYVCVFECACMYGQRQVPSSCLLCMTAHDRLLRNT